jgi:hypothetical protein
MSAKVNVQPITGMQPKIVFETPSGQNLLVTSEMRYMPRVGETVKISGKSYTVRSIEHSITDDLTGHLISILVQ